MKNNFVFILALVFTALGVFAANKPITPPGEGTEESPYLISKMEHLVWMQETVENSYRKYYKLTCDLDASETKSWNNGKGFIPIGMETPSNKRFREKGKNYPPFLGNFDGGGHSISNLYIRRPEEDYAAFFGKVGADWMPAPTNDDDDKQGGFTREEAQSLVNQENVYVIKDLALLNVEFTVGLYGAGLAGKMTDCHVSGCYVSGTITANKSVAGLATITLRSYFSECGSNITYENRFCGVAGMSVSSSGSYFCDCYSSGKFKVPETFSDPKHIGEVKNKQGGWSFHGYSARTYSGMQSYGNSFYENCYSNLKQQGSQRSKSSKPMPKQESVKSCYCSADNFGVSKEPGEGIISNENMRKKETFKGWDFEKIWEMKSGRKAPSLRKLEKWM